ncbi:hypothetical protein DRP53_09990 [candidate division WOR-3 bacterium]|uniref:Uncharacterized protein n=1 Tax=candidate division WOR-3 bacterium TaxID=2052148 RepID=A0A660SF06_UNCW3|nr:MAG: hypothetical protein DRP53_09990 [candidate division WOR-3 bacterium]
MKEEWIEEAKRITFDRFPEFKGIEPEVKSREYKVSSRLLAKLGLGGRETIRRETILTFVREFTADDGVKMKRILKVHIDSRGRITKFSGTK